MSCVGRFVQSLAIACFLALALSCKPKAGGKCDGGKSACADNRSALICSSGAYVAVSCKGGGGCADNDGIVQCDLGGDADGEPCVDLGDHALYCTADKDHAATCKGGKVSVIECDGKGCFPDGDKMRCDARPKLREGEPCNGEGIDSCDDTAKLWLTCTKGKWALTDYCRGPNGCKPFAGTLACDSTFGRTGDPCEGASRCDEADHAVLTCTDHRLVLAKQCADGEHCHADGANTACMK